MIKNYSNQDSVLGDYVLQWQRKIEERDRQRREKEKEIERQRKAEEARRLAEEERLRKKQFLDRREKRKRAEEEAILRARRKKNIGIAVLILIVLVGVIVAVKKISDAVAEKHAVEEAYEMIEQGKELVSTYHFDEAKDLYDQAYRMTMDKDVRKAVQEQNSELAKARQIADVEYNKALNRLKILLDADDNGFNQYSNECLDKMIEIYPNRQETIYYKKLRGK